MTNFHCTIESFKRLYSKPKDACKASCVSVVAKCIVPSKSSLRLLFYFLLGYTTLLLAVLSLLFLLFLFVRWEASMYICVCNVCCGRAFRALYFAHVYVYHCNCMVCDLFISVAKPPSPQMCNRISTVNMYKKRHQAKQNTDSQTANTVPTAFTNILLTLILSVHTYVYSTRKLHHGFCSLRTFQKRAERQPQTE